MSKTPPLEAGSLTPFEQAILNNIQWEFPLSPDPYGEIAARLDSTRDAVYDAVTDLRRRGIIRRLGGTFDAKKLGYVSLLVAASVAPDQLATVAAAASAFAEVTHNYERSHSFNLWFTIIGENQERVDTILNDIRGRSGVRALYALPAQRTFKIKVDFQFEAEDPHAERA
ncbi:MAG TPA: Lrp/AsnC family transcriptional regulator [Armatimonadota bacterium]|jgi:DNA-binding Lrp family transcriptional regulator